MLACATAGHLPILQIHDELCFNIQNKKVADEIKKIMEGCIEFKVPFVVDKKLGDSWGNAK
jgi:DNA polymerase I-like protein with 3'-5' exonuclease and polymerase domains